MRTQLGQEVRALLFLVRPTEGGIRCPAVSCLREKEDSLPALQGPVVGSTQLQ
jgi:hypothetical protein